MELLSIIGYIAGVLGLVSVIVTAVIIARSTTTKVTIANQNELISVLTQAKTEQKEQIVVLQAQHTEAMKGISNLQGQVDVLKNIPLVNIDTTLKEIAKFNKTLADSNAKILASLTQSASTLATNTAEVAAAVKDVKSDLKDK